MTRSLSSNLKPSVVAMGDGEATDEPPASTDLGSGAGVALALVDGTDSLSLAQTHWLRSRILAALGHLGLGGELRVRLGADAEVAAVHQKHLGIPGTTDVITFDLSDPSLPSPSPFLDADLLVCLDEAKRQSTLRGIPLERELLLYVLHGVMHCLGMDDHDEAEAERMHRREDEVLTAIGVGPTFFLAPHDLPGATTEDSSQRTER